jgi:YidC/Oxa1 family membrane protein insertase
MVNLLGAALSNPSAGAWPLTKLFIMMIQGIYGGIFSYALTIILVTLIIRVCMFPLDVWQKYSQRQMSEGQARIAPEMQKLQKNFGHNKQLMQAKQMELYKKNGISPAGNCLSMLANMVLSMFVLFTMVQAVNRMSGFMIEKQFDGMNTFYVESVISQMYDNQDNGEVGVYEGKYLIKEITEIENEKVVVYYDRLLTGDKGEKFDISFGRYSTTNSTVVPDADDQFVIGEDGQPTGELTPQNETFNAILDTASKDAAAAYNNKSNHLKESFLWIANIWQKDNQNPIIPDFAASGIGNMKWAINLGFAKQTDYDNFIEYVGNDAKKETKYKVFEEDGTTFTTDYNKYLEYNKVIDYVKDETTGVETIKQDQVINKADYENWTAQITAKLAERYNGVTGVLRSENTRWNGFYILSIMAGATTFLSVWFTKYQQKRRNKKLGLPEKVKTEQELSQERTARVTQFIMPVVMVVFTIFYSSVFAIYVVAGQLITFGLSFASAPIVDKLLKWKQHRIANPKAKKLKTANGGPEIVATYKAEQTINVNDYRKPDAQAKSTKSTKTNNTKKK